jgi:hypothetical protein
LGEENLSAAPPALSITAAAAKNCQRRQRLQILKTKSSILNGIELNYSFSGRGRYPSLPMFHIIYLKKNIPVTNGRSHDELSKKYV